MQLKIKHKQNYYSLHVAVYPMHCTAFETDLITDATNPFGIFMSEIEGQRIAKKMMRVLLKKFGISNKSRRRKIALDQRVL